MAICNLLNHLSSGEEMRPDDGALTVSLIFSYWDRSSSVLLIHWLLSSGRTSRYSCRQPVCRSAYAEHKGNARPHRRSPACWQRGAKETRPKPLYWDLIGGPGLFGSYLPAYAAKAAAPQPAADACLPDPSQVITVEEQVIPFFPAGRKEIYELLSQKAGTPFQLMHHAAVQQEAEAVSWDQVLDNPRKTHLYERNVDWGWELLLPSRDPPGETEAQTQKSNWKLIWMHKNGLINFLTVSKRVIGYFLKHVEEQKNKNKKLPGAGKVQRVTLHCSLWR